MASAFSIARLCLSASRRLPPLQSRSRPGVVRPRWLGTSVPRWAERKSRDEEEEDNSNYNDSIPTLPKTTAEENMKALSAQLKALGFGEGCEEIFREMTTEAEDLAKEAEKETAAEKILEEQIHRIELGDRPRRQSFWYDDEDPETSTEEHDQFDEDDMTSMAHGKLEEVREMRHYARLIAWEMPLLSKFAKPFEPPKEDEVLRWRYTTYMGESHPAEKKVVVQFAPADMGLTPVQTEKLKKLAGPRYDPTKEMVKMSCESFEFKAQNRRYLSDLVDKLVVEAKDPTDTFEDVPLDLRHKRTTPKPRFPFEWRMTDERRQQLEEHRRKAALADEQRTERGAMVDGQGELDKFLAKFDAAAEAAAKAEVQAVGSRPASGVGSARASGSSRSWAKR
ncbi:hypothetical protein XA68_13897 [Ophiocordyceps unilateralis]|uniref:Small ribosomal subunit protein mS35 mitochondrial conserved domain-containing protein n=1 Tax=Ophiocordyceps unilateralis TaxID=268505 RepID=A0A2A9PBM6_OPHUN|nr:hypothetical protein XA68_13897 [Ophiocordyceps unilateralis]